MPYSAANFIGSQAVHNPYGHNASPQPLQQNTVSQQGRIATQPVAHPYMPAPSVSYTENKDIDQRDLRILQNNPPTNAPCENAPDTNQLMLYHQTVKNVNDPSEIKETTFIQHTSQNPITSEIVTKFFQDFPVILQNQPVHSGSFNYSQQIHPFQQPHPFQQLHQDYYAQQAHPGYFNHVHLPALRPVSASISSQSSPVQFSSSTGQGQYMTSFHNSYSIAPNYYPQPPYTEG